MLAFIGFPGPMELLIITFILGVPIVVVLGVLWLTLADRQRPSMLPCPHCGAAAPRWAQFCPNCGGPLRQPPQPPTEPSP